MNRDFFDDHTDDQEALSEQFENQKHFVIYKETGDEIVRILVSYESASNGLEALEELADSPDELAALRAHVTKALEKAGIDPPRPPFDPNWLYDD